ncbi:MULTISPECIES: XRE family transcriptional regulator [Capnocytophaga]|jgi:hypothetical protein|uniref:XRE family transcriptional regulator n=1 Tax=Capnocytophaga sputigena TaxID=1019 RepID=UPI00288B8EB7|nr:XRE family transcriptional regulator [Capnocytophaga sputigena]
MIKNEMQYNAIMKRIGELLQIVDDNTHESNPDYIELMILTDLVEAYEDMYYPIENTLSSQSLTLSPNSESLKTSKVIA